jgi:hypothetical protein
MTKPSTTDEIPQLCKATFLTINRAIVILYVACGIVLGGVGTAVTYAISASTLVATLKEKTAENESRINKLETDINKKLDILIKGKD